MGPSRRRTGRGSIAIRLSVILLADRPIRLEEDARLGRQGGIAVSLDQFTYPVAGHPFAPFRYFAEQSDRQDAFEI